MTWIDWCITLVPMLLCLGLAVYARRFTRSVADFMAGGRHAGRYLICAARNENGAGAPGLIAELQVFMAAGFTVVWWRQLQVLTMLAVAVTGFIIYRYRQTRAMTLAQFFEMRYNRRFRLFAGLLAIVGGLLNFGVIPYISSKFFIYYLQWPSVITLGGVAIKTPVLMMAFLLGTALLITAAGGQLTVLLTDCMEGLMTMYLQVFLILVIVFTYFQWGSMHADLLHAQPGHSLVNPFDASETKDFNLWFVLVQIFLFNTSLLAWQNQHAFNSCAISPHESRMGYVLGQWRSVLQQFTTMFICFCALVYLHSTHGAAAVEAALQRIPDPGAAKQMQGPIALALLLPAGAKGALLASTLMGTIAAVGMHLHSWGSIFIQDVVMPFRGRPLPVRSHLRLLRWSVVGVAVWAGVFGVLFPLEEYLTLWFSITMVIFTGGAGCAIIGGLYWSRGTAAGAWSGLILGSTISIGSIIFRLVYQRRTGHEFAINPQNFAFIATILSMLTYVVVSLLTCRQPHNMDKLLHRGAYAVAADGQAVNQKRAPWWQRVIGINENFSRSDRVISLGVFGWGLFWFGVFVVGTVVYQLVYRWSDDWWADYWMFTAVVLPVGLLVATTGWFTWGCTRDLAVFFRRLREEQVDASDDGSVTPAGH